MNTIQDAGRFANAAQRAANRFYLAQSGLGDWDRETEEANLTAVALHSESGPGRRERAMRRAEEAIEAIIAEGRR